MVSQRVQIKVLEIGEDLAAVFTSKGACKLVSKHSQINFYGKDIRIQSRTLIAQIGQSIIYLDAFVFKTQTNIGLETYLLSAV